MSRRTSRLTPDTCTHSQCSEAVCVFCTLLPGHRPRALYGAPSTRRLPAVNLSRLPSFSSVSLSMRHIRTCSSRARVGNCPVNPNTSHREANAEAIVTPGISALEYAERRDALAKAMPPNSVAILAGADTKYRSGAVFYEFHQDPDFFYLTGMGLGRMGSYLDTEVIRQASTNPRRWL